MKMCQDHWDKLRKAIDDRGLSHLVANCGEAAVEALKDQVEGGESKRNYDPLLACNFMIWNAALEAGGAYLMTDDYCPICEAIKHRADMVDPKLGRPYTAEEEESYWVDGPADAALQHCRELGLVPVQQ